MVDITEKNCSNVQGGPLFPLPSPYRMMTGYPPRSPMAGTLVLVDMEEEVEDEAAASKSSSFWSSSKKPAKKPFWSSSKKPAKKPFGLKQKANR